MDTSLVLAGLLAGMSFGGIVFTSLLVAPIIFNVLDRSAAQDFTRVMWPRYFLAHAVLGVVVAGLVTYGRHHLVYSITASVTSGALMGVNYGIARLLRAKRGTGAAEDDESYAWLHRVTVWLNWVCLVLMGGVLYRLLSVSASAVV